MCKHFPILYKKKVVFRHNENLIIIFGNLAKVEDCQ